jgi:hypothetical protein
MYEHKTREYTLICEVKNFIRTLNEFNNKTGETRTEDVKCVALIPNLEYTESQIFLSDWMPEPEKQYNEVAARLLSPINTLSRLAVCREAKEVRQPHLFVMTTGVEDALKNLDGKKIKVLILEPTEENDRLLDSAPSINRTAIEQ